MSRRKDTAEKRVALFESMCRQVVRRCGPLPIQAVFLYGSALDEGFRQDSDIDIAVLDEAGHPLSWEEQARLMDALERALGRSVDLRMLRDSSLSHQAHVLEQGRIVWAGDESEVEWFARKVRDAARQQRERSTEEWPKVLERLAGRAVAGR